jgi:hypothetical protein
MTLRIFYAGVVAFFILAALFIYGYTQSFFITLIWWDVLMHFLGGVWAGFIGAWFVSFFGYRVKVVHFVVGSIVLGAAVEVLEYFVVVGRNPFMSYEFDTTKDMIVDAIGGLVAGYLLKGRTS